MKSKIFYQNFISNYRYRIWIWMLFLSFSYERPIFFISSFDRLNPRLFDLVLVAGFLMTFKTYMVHKEPISQAWLHLILWMTFCVTVGMSVYSFPVDMKFYMIYYLFEYIKELMIILIFLKIPKKYYSINDILIPIIVGGIFVASYCVYEFTVGIDHIDITGDKELIKAPWQVWGPFGSTYFEIANYIPFAFAISYTAMLNSQGLKKFSLLASTLFIIWPVFFTGSRTGIFLLVATFAIILLLNLKKNMRSIIFLLMISIPIALFTNMFDMFFDPTQNDTIQRLIGLEDSSEHSITGRIGLFEDFSIFGYDVGVGLPLIGAGFYVAPINEHFRVGFGFHNIYIFALEQLGVIGLVLFILFIVASIKILMKGLRILNKKSYEYWFVVGVFAYFIASLIIGISGHTFWRGFATNNFNTLRLLLLVTASRMIFDYMQLKRKI